VYPTNGLESDKAHFTQEGVVVVKMPMKRPNRRVIETDITDSLLELRLPNTHARYTISGAAVLLWNFWKRQPDLDLGVAAVVKKYNVPEAQARQDAQKLYTDLEAAGLLE
jgi:Coenzyme PQQ synthesis protein D (PqqD)